MTTPEIIRKPSVAGSRGFYTSDPEDLKEQIKSFLSGAELVVKAKPFGLIAPHAGYIYSGPVAGWAYRQIVGHSYRRVIVIAPSHAEAIPFNSIMPKGKYETPLGLIEIDSEFASEIADQGYESIRLSNRGHIDGNFPSREHSLEVQLPFLQHVLGDFKLVPIIMGLSGWQAAHELGEAIAADLDENTLIVASSDLSHFHSYDEANRIDGNFIEHLNAFDAEGIAEGCYCRSLEACGGAPIAALMAASASKGLKSIEILKHQNSGDIKGGSRQQVVGYLAAAITGSNEILKDEFSINKNTKAQTKISGGSGTDLSQEEKSLLISLARNAILTTLNRTGSGIRDYKLTPELEKKRGMFVTLKDHGRLRGCIGRLLADVPLHEMVKRVAIQAAFDDPRFVPLNNREFRNISIEITVLGQMTTAVNPEEIEIGKHGILIRRGGYQGLLLPQVATEQGWDRTQFLEYTCQKAGLPKDAWQDKRTEILIFTADVFGE